MIRYLLLCLCLFLAQAVQDTSFKGSDDVIGCTPTGAVATKDKSVYVLTQGPECVTGVIKKNKEGVSAPASLSTGGVSGFRLATGETAIIGRHNPGGLYSSPFLGCHVSIINQNDIFGLEIPGLAVHSGFSLGDRLLLTGLLNPRVYPSYTPGGLQTQPYPGIIAVSKMDKYWSENVKIEVVWQKETSYVEGTVGVIPVRSLSPSIRSVFVMVNVAGSVTLLEMEEDGHRVRASIPMALTSWMSTLWQDIDPYVTARPSAGPVDSLRFVASVYGRDEYNHRRTNVLFADILYVEDEPPTIIDRGINTLFPESVRPVSMAPLGDHIVLVLANGDLYTIDSVSRTASPVSTPASSVSAVASIDGHSLALITTTHNVDTYFFSSNDLCKCAGDSFCNDNVCQCHTGFIFNNMTCQAENLFDLEAELLRTQTDKENAQSSRDLFAVLTAIMFLLFATVACALAKKHQPIHHNFEDGDYIAEPDEESRLIQTIQE